MNADYDRLSERIVYETGDRYFHPDTMLRTYKPGEEGFIDLYNWAVKVGSVVDDDGLYIEVANIMKPQYYLVNFVI